ncbi:hypothetical protein [Anaeromyxobacter sp. SG26]|uniref:hypothetical protein n=1 Tax=Anaeromyxobacter sp. SG26 TaxID=2925407 RepID=UPI001F575D24|nr:hypothetical protein [Anaeromyxobacter sp. SG26]
MKPLEIVKPDARDLAGPGQQAHPPTPRLGLSRLDQAAVAAFTSGDTGEIVEDTRQLADALAGPDGDPARVRLMARAVAAARTQQRVLEALLGDRLAKRDREGVELVTAVLDGVSRRLAMFTKHLAAESALRRRPTVVIGRADTVSIGGGR